MLNIIDNEKEKRISLAKGVEKCLEETKDVITFYTNGRKYGTAAVTLRKQ